MQKAVLFIGNHLSFSKSNVSATEELEIRLQERNWKILSTSNKKNKILRIIDILSTIIIKKDVYDLVIINVYSGLAFLWAYLSGLTLRIIQKPFILVLHGGNLPVFSKKHPKAIMQLFNWANKVISPSLYLKFSLKSFHPDIKIIPNPIEVKSYPFVIRKKPKAKLIWLRAFHEIYNPSLIPKVIHLLENKFDQLSILMVGPDQGDGSLSRMKSLAEEFDVSEMISIHLGVSKAEVPKMLSLGDIFLNTTNIDNTPVSVIEAMACGLCIVSTNVGGIPFLLEHEKDALLVPPNDPGSMADAIVRIMNDPSLACKLSENARKKAESFDWSIVLPQWEELLKSGQKN